MWLIWGSISKKYSLLAGELRPDTHPRFFHISFSSFFQYLFMTSNIRKILFLTGEEWEIQVRDQNAKAVGGEEWCLPAFAHSSSCNKLELFLFPVPVLNHTQLNGSNFLIHFCIINVCNMTCI